MKFEIFTNTSVIFVLKLKGSSWATARGSEASELSKIYKKGALVSVLERLKRVFVFAMNVPWNTLCFEDQCRFDRVLFYYFKLQSNFGIDLVFKCSLSHAFNISRHITGFT
ncbi:hypothetical protein CARUB_v10018278mg [Capsella rubella]|uniref:Uncharacterized protein n=1 Tax=Capsella rubella TaxID=81985 RepID=R0FRW0_9BRAS|nr:hypothetical protein CARUB_v10018278mg [Capsella rubella]